MKCCICDKEILGFGNNPYPVVKDPEAECCDDCNFHVVIPTRIKLAKRSIFNEDINRENI